MTYGYVTGHRSMVMDQRRNEYYLAAMEQIINHNSVVLDAGAGLGVLGLIAAQLGAKHVYLVEPADVISMTKTIVSENGLDGRVTCIQGKIEEVDLPQKVDLILSVFTGNFLLGEDLLPALFSARDKFLKPDGRLLPDKGVMEIVPVSIEEFYQEHIQSWSDPKFGLTFESARAHAVNTVFFGRDYLKNALYLADPIDLMSLDFRTAQDTNCHEEAQIVCNKSGLCHGFVGWFRMRLGEQWLSTGLHEPELHWSPAFLPIEPPLAVEIGDKIRIRIDRPAYGDWSWQVRIGPENRKYSTFFSLPLTKSRIRKSALNFKPELNRDGLILSYILNSFDGTQSTITLAEALCTKFPAEFSSENQAISYVKKLIYRFS